MANNKSPGFLGVTTNMLKSLPDDALDLLTSIIEQFWNDPDTDIPLWHRTKLTSLYKGKGSPHDPNNWRGICLKEQEPKLSAA